MTSRPRHNQPPGEPSPDPQLERLIREAVASQHVPPDRQQLHLARIKRQGQALAAMSPWTASDTNQRASFTDDIHDPRLPATGQHGPPPVLPPTRTRRRQLTELTFGLLGFVVVAALLVALFREDPDDSLGATDLTHTPSTTATIAPTTAPATTTLPAIDAPANTPLTETGPPDTPTPNDTPAPAPTPTNEGTVTLTNEQTLAGYGVLTRWDAKVYNLAALTVGPDDRVYALDSDTGLVSIYTLEETLVGSIDLTGSGGAPLVDGHYDLAVDGNGTLYLLARFLNSWATDVYRYEAGSSDIGTSLWLANSEPLVNALAIAVADDGLLYVAENLPNGNGRIRTFDTDGLETARWEEAGDAPMPSGIQSIEVTDDAVYILVDSSNNAGSILRFNLDGTFVGVQIRFAYNQDETERPLKHSLAVDPAGNVFVVNPEDGSVTGYFLTTEASGMLLHWSPDDVDDPIERTPNVHVAVDSRGYIYILQSERVLMTVLAPPEAIEEARQPTLNVLPRSGTCADELTAHGGYYVEGDEVTILARVSDGDEFVEVGRATVVHEEGNPAPSFNAPISLEPLGICESEIPLTGVEITYIARAQNDQKQPEPATFTLYSATATPSLTLTPATGDCTTSVTATGTGFIPGTTVTLMLGGHSPLPLAHGVAVDDTGTFEVALSAPEFPECIRSPESPLTTEMTVFASTEWPDKREPYPSAQATFTVTAAD